MEHLTKQVNIYWDVNKLQEIMFSYPRSQWRREPGISNNYLRIPEHEYLDHLMDQIAEQGYNPRNRYFAELLSGANLPVHTDFSRSNAINFPVHGDWSNSPLEFYSDDRSEVIYTYHYTPKQAVWINTQVPHGVRNAGSKSRFILSISLYH